MRKLTARGAWWQFVSVLERREAFETGGALSGGYEVWRWGQLPYEYRESVKAADYVVFSYSTPIAWHLPTDEAERLYPHAVLDTMARDRDGFWCLPDQRYAAITTRHQHKIAEAIKQLAREQAAREMQPEVDAGDTAADAEIA